MSFGHPKPYMATIMMFDHRNPTMIEIWPKFNR